uniref:Uncharacterized protein n=1 Tax=Lygus hesperus TaxID=30085 RepID=A0A0K8SXP4_LYGHE
MSNPMSYVQTTRPDCSPLKTNKPWMGKSRIPVAWNIPVGKGRRRALKRDPEPPQTPAPHRNPERPGFMMAPGLPRGLRPGQSLDFSRKNPWENMYTAEDLMQCEAEEERIAQERKGRNRFEDPEWGMRATGFEDVVGCDPNDPFGSDAFTNELEVYKPIRPGWGKPQYGEYDRLLKEWDEADVWKKENKRQQGLDRRNRFSSAASGSMVCHSARRTKLITLCIENAEVANCKAVIGQQVIHFGVISHCRSSDRRVHQYAIDSKGIHLQVHEMTKCAIRQFHQRLCQEVFFPLVRG